MHQRQDIRGLPGVFSLYSTVEYENEKEGVKYEQEMLWLWHGAPFGIVVLYCPVLDCSFPAQHQK